MPRWCCLRPAPHCSHPRGGQGGHSGAGPCLPGRHHRAGDHGSERHDQGHHHVENGWRPHRYAGAVLAGVTTRIGDHNPLGPAVRRQPLRRAVGSAQTDNLRVPGHQRGHRRQPHRLPRWIVHLQLTPLGRRTGWDPGTVHRREETPATCSEPGCRLATAEVGFREACLPRRPRLSGTRCRR